VSILEYDMNIPDDINLLKNKPGAQYTGTPELEAPDRARYGIYDAVTGELTRQKERRPKQYECAQCMYYDPERAYCTYIYAPVDILFVCPQVLDNPMRR